MKTVEAFAAAQYPCPDCDYINTMRVNLEHNNGYRGFCKQCKRHWEYKEVGVALIKKHKLIGIDGFKELDRFINNFAVDFDCDNCGYANTILPVSISTTEYPGKRGFGKIISRGIYESNEDIPLHGRCKFCNEEYELEYSLPCDKDQP